MILTSLHQLYDRLAGDPAYGIAQPGYSPQKISFRALIHPDGTLFQIQDARIKDENGRPHAEAQLVIGKGKSAGPGINPGFLWENTTYMLGYKQDDPKPARTQKSFEAFRDKHLALEQEINLSDFSSICRFLENWSPEKAHEYAEAHPGINDLTTGFGVFQMHTPGQIKAVNEHPEILKWWDSQQDQATGDVGQCLITGKQGSIARLHPKIKSVTGAQSAGASIVSFNASAYESYGKDQSFNAPVSEYAAFKYGTALNSLLNGPQSSRHRIRIGDTTCVYWTEKPSPIVEVALPFFFSNGSNAPEESQDQAQRSKIETFLKSLRQGTDILEKAGEDTHANHFYILGLAPNAARIAIRFFHQSTLEEFIENLRAHHRDIEIIREWESPKGNRLPDPEYPANWQLLRETARVSDEIPPLLGGALMRSILENTKYPEGLYSAVIRRIRADRTINYIRVSIIKGTLTRNHDKNITIMLDTKNTDPAYLLGRLFATLEKTQKDALGDLNSGLRDKFYSSASATPASIYPRILRTYQHWLAKLEGGHKINRERLVQDIISGISADGFPHNLNLKSQGIFAIGYYHQNKDFYTKKETTTEA